MQQDKNFWLVVIALVIAVALIVGYLYMANQNNLSYENERLLPRDRGNETLMQKLAVEEAARESNPFKVDPFAKVKDVLNPFE